MTDNSSWLRNRERVEDLVRFEILGTQRTALSILSRLNLDSVTVSYENTR